MTSAVLTIGLPDLAEKYEESKLMWGPLLASIGDDWSTRLTKHMFLPPTGITIEDTV